MDKCTSNSKTFNKDREGATQLGEFIHVDLIGNIQVFPHCIFEK